MIERQFGYKGNKGRDGARGRSSRGFRKVARFSVGAQEMRRQAGREGGIKRGIGDEEGKKLCQFLRLRPTNVSNPLSIETIFPEPIYIYIYIGYVK